MGVTPLHDPSTGQLQIVALMSGFGSNLSKILEHEKQLERLRGESPYKVAAIFTDNAHSSAQTMGDKQDIQVVVNPYKDFCKARDAKRKNKQVRREYDQLTVELIQGIGATVAAYAGYELYATKVLTSAVLGINVHPADLAIRNNDGSPKYGGHIRHGAVEAAIKAGETQIRSSTHIVEEELDGGRILMRSDPFEVDLSTYRGVSSGSPEELAAIDMQHLLKSEGDWKIFPKTLELIADGRFGQDEKGNLYLDNKPIPTGIEWGEIQND